ncbi:hypothetical protein WJU16_13595 [Chitinophaga pollutisoli]|uniref:Tetratricopeptide repeat protein n=1 Tax=Chitinophaga pollutisoli TaxID=3133966 RepID=A0ABZ2YGU3_9BACT
MKKIYLSAALLLTMTSVSAQSARELFDAAKTAYENGRFNESIRLIRQCEQLLGRSNPKIESLKTHVYYSTSDWSNAYLAASRYFNMAPASNAGSVAHKELETIRQEVTGKMKSLHKDHFKTIDDKRMEQANKVTALQDASANTKSTSIRNRSEKRLKSIYLASSDAAVLKEYTDMFGQSGDNKVFEEKKVYLRHIVLGDKFLEEKNYRKALDHYESGYQFIKSDTLALRIAKTKEEFLYRTAEKSNNLEDYLAYAEKYPSGRYAHWVHTTLVRYYKEETEGYFKKKSYPEIATNLTEGSKYLKHCSREMKEKYYATLLAAANLLENDRKAIRKDVIRCREVITYYTYYQAYKPTVVMEKKINELKASRKKWHKE